MQLPTAPPPLAAHTVATVLAYLHPALSLPLPAHLVSHALAQRHHFLGIAPSDAHAYLSWPASSPADAAAPSVLDALGALPPHADDGPALPVRYTADADSAYAHVLAAVPALDCTLRLVFQWDGAEAAWKYHDASTAPLPPTSFGLPGDALAAVARASSSQDRRTPSSEGDDDYWNSYGGADDDDREHAGTSLQGTATPGGEDAYWAQYNSVHGTADSTIPSPVREKRRLHPWGAHSGSQSRGDASPSAMSRTSSGSNERPLPIPPHNAFRAARHTEEGAPPSPSALHSLLEAIPSRPAPTDDAPAPATGTTRPITPAITTRPREDSVMTIRSASPPPPTAISPTSRVRVDSLSAADVPATPSPPKPQRRISAEDVGLQQAIAGLHSLWLAGRRARGAASDPDAFLHLVRAAIE